MFKFSGDAPTIHQLQTLKGKGLVGSCIATSR